MMHRFTFLLVPLCLLAGLLAAGCSGNLRGGDDAREQEIQALKARILQLQQEAAMNQVEVAQLRQKVAELDARNGGTRPPVRPPASSALSAPAPAKPSTSAAPTPSAAAPPPRPTLPVLSGRPSTPPAPVRRE